MKDFSLHIKDNKEHKDAAIDIFFLDEEAKLSISDSMNCDDIKQLAEPGSISLAKLDGTYFDL